MKNRVIYILILLVALLVAGCATDENTFDELEINIAYQYGLSYAPFEIMKEKKILEEKLPDVKINWYTMSSGGAMNEGIIAGDIDVALMGTAPFLIGYDKGIDYKIISSIVSQRISLITSDPSITSLSKLKASDKIAVPSVGSIQHLALAMAAEKELGDAKALDKNLINMSSPEAFQAVSSKQEVKAHMATPPYSNASLEMEGHQLIIDSSTFLEEDTSVIVAVGTESVKNENPEVYDAINEALAETIEYIYNNIDAVSQFLGEKEGLEVEAMKRYLQSDLIKYQQEVIGISRWADFMKEEGYISKVASEEEYIFK